MSETTERRTLVTGGAGFIGSHLVDALLTRGEQVICLDNFDDYYSPERKRRNAAHHAQHDRYVLVEGDIRDRATIDAIFEEYQPQRVAHLAAMAGVRASIERAPLYTEVNVNGTINVFEAARQHEVENLVLASTSSVYGRTEQTPFLEDQSTDGALAPYPATKKACEVMAHAYHNMFGMNITALRFFTVYGPRVRSDMMAYIVMDRILRGETIRLFNGGEMHRDWTFVADITNGVVAALDKPLGFEIMNIGRGQPVRLGDFVEIIEELVGKNAVIDEVPAPASEPPITYANVDKARRLLGYEPQVSIQDGLLETWNWFKDEIAAP
ncbi:MAG: SDR family NAD(P)-dependent oxidoreductase [Chloroflexi bacterium]|nr:SDR family NAD(P)-dependent oxidoreductase [Chloroflexota bacterium]